ncbi:metallophosphoesterase family protein [Terasakiella sp. A23]|uniref:metallophosphoesterase family protein n=1 Tax=Terasakiella sp. FCG-A23 TaxID=3080561 RepID=UPI002955D674|nr:metallophosphoesterase family protein [Terasakiella sp. A23]MDV7339289.1 metallophosphoesterase family protein [Terasakiella sp. A23]
MRSLFRKLTRQSNHSTQQLDSAQTNSGDRIYAIGDIHGRADLVEKLLQNIFLDINQCNDKKNIKLVFLGDYVDRGLHSKQVIEILSQPAPANIEYVFIKGNHEEAMLNFLDSPDRASEWLQYGGTETLLSYGASMKAGKLSAKDLKEVAENLLNQMPEQHVRFLTDLQDSYENGGYFFTHAGIDPKTPLSSQKGKHLRWIREDFIHEKQLYEKVIVHGHTITNDALLLNNRIAVDTGAYYSGKLTCIVLDGSEKRIIHT